MPDYAGAIVRKNWEKHGERPSVLDWGAIADCLTGSDAAITATSLNVTSPSGAFAASMKGKPIVIAGAGVAGADLITIVASFTDATAMVVADPASTTVTGTNFWCGSDNGTAFDKAFASAKADELDIPNGAYLFLTGNLRLREGLQLRGKGIRTTILYFAASVSLQGPNTVLVAEHVASVSLAAFTISRAGVQNGTAISLTGVWNSEVRRLKILGFLKGIDLEGDTLGCYGVHVQQNIISNCAVGIRLCGANGQSANTNTIAHNRIDGCTTGIFGDPGDPLDFNNQGNFIYKNDIEGLVGTSATCIDYTGYNSVLTQNWVESVAGSGKHYVGVKLRGSANVLLNNKYSMVATGTGTVVQVDKDDTAINTVVETSTGGDAIFDFASGFNSLLMRLIATGGPPRLRFWRQDARTSEKMIELGISGILPESLWGDDGHIVNGSFSFESLSAAFSGPDVGKAIIVTGAGLAGADLVTTVASITDATHCVLAASASTTVTGADYWHGEHFFYIAHQDDGANTINLPLKISLGGNNDASLTGSLLLNGTLTKVSAGNSLPNSSIFGNVGDVWIDTGGSGIWIKSSGNNTNTGWTAYLKLYDVGHAAIGATQLESNWQTDLPSERVIFGGNIYWDPLATNWVIPARADPGRDCAAFVLLSGGDVGFVQDEGLLPVPRTLSDGGFINALKAVFRAKGGMTLATNVTDPAVWEFGEQLGSAAKTIKIHSGSGDIEILLNGASSASHAKIINAGSSADLLIDNQAQGDFTISNSGAGTGALKLLNTNVGGIRLANSGTGKINLSDGTASITLDATLARITIDVGGISIEVDGTGSTIKLNGGVQLTAFGAGAVVTDGSGNVSVTAGYSGTITTAKLTVGGSNGSMTFVGGILTAQVAAT